NIHLMSASHLLYSAIKSPLLVQKSLFQTYVNESIDSQSLLMNSSRVTIGRFSFSSYAQHLLVLSMPFAWIRAIVSLFHLTDRGDSCCCQSSNSQSFYPKSFRNKNYRQ